MHPSRTFTALSGAIGVAFVLTLSAAASQPSAQSSGATPTPVAATTHTPSGQAEYVGQEMCVTCHEGVDKSLAGTAHARAADPRSPAAKQGCESCHGPGGKHIEDPSASNTLRKFDKITPAEASAACVSCHNKSEHRMWEGSAHDARNVSCVTCHSVHAPKSERAQLKTATQVETCATCHKTQTLKVRRSAHMPVQEGKMECSTCHNPHGSSNVKNLRVGNYVNESCVSCHTEKRGPFLFEHAAGRESCVSCHDPHGSSNDRMLVAKMPMLCQRCHVHTRHPGTMYDNLAVASKSNRIIGRSCVNCHQQIHGTNHPSGAVFVR
jgi:DmsE family decaheme c-type cytochrome